MKIVIKNFQSIESAKLEPQGFTVITGKSNLGKSAVIRAISAALFGWLGDHYVRNGKDQAGVGISIDPGFEVKWRKVRSGRAIPGRETELEVNGVTHTKIGREQLPLTEPLGMKEIRAGNIRTRPQVAMQHDPVFLLTNSETEVAEILRLLGRADVVAEAQKNERKDLKEAEARLKLRQEDEKKALEAMDELHYVPGLRRDLNNLKNHWAFTLLKVQDCNRVLERLIRLKQNRPTPLPTIPTPGLYPIGAKILQQIDRLKKLQPLQVPQGVNEPVYPDQKYDLWWKIDRHRVLRYELALTRDDQRTIQEKILELEKERTELEKRLGRCPVCERFFVGEGVAEHSHA